MSNTAQLTRMVRLGEALPNLPEQALFHAGPPYKESPPDAVLNAAAQAAVMEGWATDTDAARGLLLQSPPAIKLLPAQDHGLVVPLAQVAGPSTWCVEVGNEALKVYSPVSEGPAPALRFGSIDPLCRERAQNDCKQFADHINPLLENAPIHPEALMQQALQLGDDGHAIVSAGTKLWVNALEKLPDATREKILTNAGFALTTWMAYCSWKLHTSSSAINAIGANGIEFGVKFKNTNEWITVSAPPPSGPRFKPDHPAQALGAIGDSAVVDACGYGGQALKNAPTLLTEWKDYLPDDATTRPDHILCPESGCIDPARIQAARLAPIINLAILDRQGADTPIGRGHYCPPLSVFQQPS
ncbi:DUF1116 domain-containing protein [Neopusillimonas maritima]|uniref:DUF1116 domain-containing protein n=1 Tax=Neopusillimonas maritima TaxID=2026239 RepID=A0ABX9MWK0_9BURK|nr:DUF1116 domain-containing protein [Neopusillimonas maritima]RII83350.1 hypothetical protein CJO09_07055 [Neopusillimonas maritima]